MPETESSTGERDPARRRRLTPEMRRAQILDAAREVFIESGFNKTRIVDIAERAGLTQASVYHHFSTKEEIYRDAVKGPLDSMVDRFITEAYELASRREDASREELFYHFQEALLTSMLEIGPLLSVVLFADQAAAREFYVHFVQPRFASAIASALVEGIGWRGPAADLNFLVEAAFGAHFSMASFQLLDTHAPPSEDVAATARQMADILWSGLGSKARRVRAAG